MHLDESHMGTNMHAQEKYKLKFQWEDGYVAARQDPIAQWELSKMRTWYVFPQVLAM